MAEGYRWYHSVSLDWIRARKFVFTATELRGLIPAYKRWLKKNDPNAVDPDFLALVAEKMSEANGLDVNTFGWAARGHVMEPYAVAEYNRINGKEERPGMMYHWDDLVIGDVLKFIGFSPDALDVDPLSCKDQLVETIPCFVDCNSMDEKLRPRHMLEVKCYSPGKHIKAILSDKKKLEERYQIAVGMIVLPHIETGTLVFYNPSINVNDIGAYCQIDYSRQDLEEEIALMEKIHNLACWHLIEIAEIVAEKNCTYSKYSEGAIYKEFTDMEVCINEIS